MDKVNRAKGRAAQKRELEAKAEESEGAMRIGNFNYVDPLQFEEAAKAEAEVVY
jgi:hypothetical protein